LHGHSSFCGMPYIPIRFFLSELPNRVYHIDGIVGCVSKVVADYMEYAKKLVDFTETNNVL